MSDYTNIYTSTNEAPASEFRGESQVLNRPGGVIEVRVSADPMAAPTTGSMRSPAIQSNVGGVTTINVGGQAQFTPGVQTFSVADQMSNTDDFLSTARNGFFPANGNLTPDTIVTFKGMEATLGGLVAAKEIRKTPNGSYEAVNHQPTSGSQPQQAQGQGQKPVTDGSNPEYQLFPEVVESAVAQAVASIPQTTLDQSIAKCLVGGIDSLNFNEIAYQSGITPAEARQRADMVLNAFSAQADSIAQAQGVVAADVWEWAATERSEKFEDARRQMAFARNTVPLRALVKEYNDTVAPTVEAIKKHGYEVRKGADGSILMKYKGMWATPESLTRAGFI